MMKSVLQTHSLRQIVGQLLDNCFEVLKAFLEQAIQHDEVQPENIIQINKDLMGAISFYISNYDFIQEQTHSNSKFLRNLLFEIKHYRNNWAHSQDFSLREVHRIADTILLMFDELSLNISNEVYLFVNQIRMESIQIMSLQLQQSQKY
ncbi:unnamed protein product [Paramecium sonneborni]|uniref:Swt1-like HEPN domain-containing protein n=1 Tax=Paramecium sonneborni TaxID=65129 RepID=A0A8S1QQ16_9CILI|nr:unnamed protein product [Paramecium sonneborni]